MPTIFIREQKAPDAAGRAQTPVSAATGTHRYINMSWLAAIRPSDAVLETEFGALLALPFTIGAIGSWCLKKAFPRWALGPSRTQVRDVTNVQNGDYEGAERGWALTRKWCARAKAHFGYIPKRDAANLAAVGAWVRKEMAGENVRICDRLRVAPYAVEAVFVPSDDDVRASIIHDRLKHRKRYMSTVSTK